MPDFLAEVLTWPKSYTAALAVETAYTMGIPPTSLMLDDRQPSDPWTLQDKKLVMAWTILQKETCKECGNPIWICRSSNRDLAFGVRKGFCYAKKEMEDWQESKVAKNLKHGEIPYVYSVMRSDDPVPNRMDYYKQLEEE